MPENRRWSYFPPSDGSLSSSFRSNTKFEHLQSKFPIVSKLDAIFYNFLPSYFGDLIEINPELTFLFFSLQVVEDPKTFSSFRERLYHLQANFHPPLSSNLFLGLGSWLLLGTHIWLQRTENDRVCFGRSGIHGWGLFARRNIQEGEMVCWFKVRILVRKEQEHVFLLALYDFLNRECRNMVIAWLICGQPKFLWY